MKNLITLTLLFVTFSLLASEITNGVFYIDSPVECHLIQQNGSTITNQLIAGKTYMVADSLLELFITNKTLIYFSNGAVIEASTNSIVDISLFTQEINNLDSQPSIGDFGFHNIGLSFFKGEFSIIYFNTNINSSFTITTPIAVYELNSGKFGFQVSEQKSLVYVFDGEIPRIHGDKNRIDSVKKGKLSIVGQMEDTVATTTRDIKQSEQSNIGIMLSKIDQKINDVKFFIISGRIIGFKLK